MKIRILQTIVWVLASGMLVPAFADTIAVQQKGTELEQLVGEGQTPALSEDGTRVAFSDGNYQLWVVNRDGTGRRQLTAGHIDTNPSWSPDGRKIAFRRSAVSDGSSYSDIWIMNFDGSEPVRLTDARAAGGYYDRPTWSPDGAMLAMEAAVNGMMSEIYVMEIASRRFANATRMNTGQNNRFDHQSPVWLADGERLTAVRNDELVIVSLRPVLARFSNGSSLQRPEALVATAGAR